jgi:hypothetical protein
LFRAYISKKHPKICIQKFSDDVSTKDALASYQFYKKFFSEKRGVISIIAIEKARLKSTDFLKEAGKSTTEFIASIGEENVVGLTIIQEIFFKMYLGFIKKKKHETYTFHLLSEIEQKHNFTFSDFSCVYTTQNEQSIC